MSSSPGTSLYAVGGRASTRTAECWLPRRDSTGGTAGYADSSPVRLLRKSATDSMAFQVVVGLLHDSADRPTWLSDLGCDT